MTERTNCAPDGKFSLVSVPIRVLGTRCRELVAATRRRAPILRVVGTVSLLVPSELFQESEQPLLFAEEFGERPRKSEVFRLVVGQAGTL